MFNSFTSCGEFAVLWLNEERIVCLTIRPGRGSDHATGKVGMDTCAGKRQQLETSSVCSMKDE